MATNNSRRWYAQDADGQDYEYRRVCSTIERRMTFSRIYHRVTAEDMFRMTPTELRLIADLIEAKPGEEGNGK